ncbi:hypothetical protein BDV97DRAFT_352357 [Delphinella strobiligena]|nr:hypothetical protein BDV97DRAFT_352357 [Delphinella strobiligena]
MTSFYTSSPTVVIPPQPLPDQYFHATHYRTFQPNIQSNGLFNQFPGSVTTPPTRSSDSIVGRKRSRDDTEDDNDDSSPALPVASRPVPQGEPIYGPGMTLSYPNDPRGHYSSEVEESAEHDTASSARPVMPSRKSQRTTRATDVAQSQSNQSIPALEDESLIDEVTRMLGISWNRMDRSEGGMINQRAYTRWIERHYPSLVNVELWFENTTIPGYLGTAFNQQSGAQEYLLWSFDLKQAVLVTKQASDLKTKLSTTPPSDLIKSATISIFANSEPTFTSSPPPEAQAVAPRTTGDMEIDS